MRRREFDVLGRTWAGSGTSDHAVCRREERLSGHAELRGVLTNHAITYITPRGSFAAILHRPKEQQAADRPPAPTPPLKSDFTSRLSGCQRNAPQKRKPITQPIPPGRRKPLLHISRVPASASARIHLCPHPYTTSHRHRRPLLPLFTLFVGPREHCLAVLDPYCRVATTPAHLTGSRHAFICYYARCLHGRKASLDRPCAPPNRGKSTPFRSNSSDRRGPAGAGIRSPCSAKTTTISLRAPRDRQDKTTTKSLQQPR